MDKGIKFIWVHWPDYYSSAPGGHEYGRSLMCELFDINELGEWKDKVGSFYGFPPMPVNSWEFVNLTLAKRTWKGKAAALRLAARMAMDKLTGKRRVGSGNAMQGRMLQVALREQIPIRLATAMTGPDPGGGSRHRRHRIGARRRAENRSTPRGAARHRGFSHNLAMRQAHQPAPVSVDWTMANPGDTGEAIQMAQKLGADVDLMREAWWTPGSLLPNGRYAGFHVPGESGKPHIIIVDKNGRRIGNESGAYMEFGQKMFAAGCRSCVCHPRKPCPRALHLGTAVVRKIHSTLYRKRLSQKGRHSARAGPAMRDRPERARDRSHEVQSFRRGRR